MAPDASHNLDGNIDVSVEIDLNVLADRLVHDRAFISALAEAVRLQLSKDVRRYGNVFGTWATKREPSPGSRRRVN